MKKNKSYLTSSRLFGISALLFASAAALNTYIISKVLFSIAAVCMLIACIAHYRLYKSSD